MHRRACAERQANRSIAAPPVDPLPDRLDSRRSNLDRPIYLEVVALSSHQGLVRVDEVRAMITPFIMQFTWHTSITSSPGASQARHAHTDARNLSAMSSPTLRARARARVGVSLDISRSLSMQRRGIESHVLPEEARSVCSAIALRICPCFYNLITCELYRQP